MTVAGIADHIRPDCDRNSPYERHKESAKRIDVQLHARKGE